MITRILAWLFERKPYLLPYDLWPRGEAWKWGRK